MSATTMRFSSNWNGFPGFVSGKLAGVWFTTIRKADPQAYKVDDVKAIILDGEMLGFARITQIRAKQAADFDNFEARLDAGLSREGLSKLLCSMYQLPPTTTQLFYLLLMRWEAPPAHLPALAAAEPATVGGEAAPSGSAALAQKPLTLN